MEVGMSLNPLIRLPMKSNSRTIDENSSLVKHSIHSSRIKNPKSRNGQKLQFVVEAKGKKGMVPRQFQRPAPPALPKIEDDGNPRFVIFIRAANVFLWYPLNLVSGGTTAKIMVAAKDNFLGKYIYKDTLARNLAAVIYQDEKEIIKLAKKQFRILRPTTDFRYGYKLVVMSQLRHLMRPLIQENNDLRAALTPKDVIELPTQDQLKTVLDKVKDFFGDAKESFGKVTVLNTTSSEEAEETSTEKNKVKG